MSASTLPTSLTTSVRDDKPSVAHVIVLRDPQSASLRSIGPFATLTSASVHAYRTCRHLDDEDIQFLALTSHRGRAVPAHHIDTTNAVLDSLPTVLAPDLPAAHVVVAVHQGERQAFGPFASAEGAGRWVAEFQEHLSASPNILSLYGEDGCKQPGRAWAGVLESLITVDVVLRTTVVGEHGMRFNDVNEPECRECEYLPLIGFYGHVCGSDYVEY